MAKTATYIEAVGRRKTAHARVRLTPAKQNTMTVNDKSAMEYFGGEQTVATAQSPLQGAPSAFSISVHVKGGGIRAQAEAIRHGVARALIKHDETLRTNLKQQGFLTRDSRMKERKKFGLKKARRAPQWSKR